MVPEMSDMDMKIKVTNAQLPQENSASTVHFAVAWLISIIYVKNVERKKQQTPAYFYSLGINLVHHIFTCKLPVSYVTISIHPFIRLQNLYQATRPI